MSRPGPIAQVVFDLPKEAVFDYRIPPELVGRVVPGHRVMAPLGRGTRAGIVTAIAQTSSVTSLKTLIRLLDWEPEITPHLLRLSVWMSSYYGCSRGLALRAMIPGGFRSRRTAPRRLLEVLPGRTPSREEEAALAERASRQWALLRFLRERWRIGENRMPLAGVLLQSGAGRSAAEGLARKGLIRMHPGTDLEEAPDSAAVFPTPHRLNREQESALKGVRERLDAGGFSVLLLHGVTGSGKTEIYLRAMARVLEGNGGALLLVPEISLTPQMLHQVRGRFGARVAVLHSRLPVGARRRQWERVRTGEARIVVGVRSAVFAPVRSLQLVIVDEEQSRAFKQEEAPRYNARDVAVVRASEEGALALMGTATPSLETYSNAMSGKYGIVQMPRRVENRPLPRVRVVDMRREAQWLKRKATFSRMLLTAMKERFERSEQVILFLNRRGFAPFVTCSGCGHVLECRNCRLTLTYHRTGEVCRCHTCGYEEPVPATCPACGKKTLLFVGAGTQRVEQQLQKLFPGLRFARVDSDAMARRGAYEETFRAFRERRTDLLVGTQMIAKGLDFPNVTLVGVLQADVALSMPDFRAAETTFQLLTQVAGRAGRGERCGEVIIQTHTPEHPAIRLAAEQNYRAFYEYEIGLRRELMYPPLTGFVDVRVRGKREKAVAMGAMRIRRIAEPVPSGMRLFGPYPAPVPKKKGYFEYQIIFSLRNRGRFGPWFARRRARLDRALPPGISLTVDVDPLFMV